MIEKERRKGERETIDRAQKEIDFKINFYEVKPKIMER